MSFGTKTEEKINNIMAIHLNEFVQEMNKSNTHLSGMFLYGVIVGVIASYSGFLGYFAGVGSGLILSSNYIYLSKQITNNMGSIFQNIMSTLNRSKEKTI